MILQLSIIRYSSLFNYNIPLVNDSLGTWLYIKILIFRLNEYFFLINP